MQQCFVVLGLVGEPAIIDKDILCPLLMLGFVSYTNGRKTSIVWRGVCVNLASTTLSLCHDGVLTHRPLLSVPLGAAFNKD